MVARVPYTRTKVMFVAHTTAGASLIEEHEKKRKAQCGFDGLIRGRFAASVDAARALLGTIGLLASLWFCGGHCRGITPTL